VQLTILETLLIKNVILNYQHLIKVTLHDSTAV